MKAVPDTAGVGRIPLCVHDGGAEYARAAMNIHSRLMCCLEGQVQRSSLHDDLVLRLVENITATFPWRKLKVVVTNRISHYHPK